MHTKEAPFTAVTCKILSGKVKRNALECHDSTIGISQITLPAVTHRLICFLKNHIPKFTQIMKLTKIYF